MKVLLLILTLVSTQVFAQTFYDLSTPRNTFKTFLKHIVEIKNNRGSKKEHYKKIATIFDSKSIKSFDVKDISSKLINSLDRIEKINYQEIPEKPAGDKWTYLKRKVKLNNSVFNTEISFTKVDKKWLLSKQTIKSISYLQDFLKFKDTVKGVAGLITWKTKLKSKLPAWTGARPFVLLNGQWIGLFLIILLGIIAEKIGRIVIAKFIVKKLDKRNIKLDQKKEKKFMMPFGIMSFSIIWYFAIRLLELDPSTLNIFLRIGQIAFSFSVVGVSHHTINILAMYFGEKAEATDNKFDDIMIPLVRKSAIAFIYVVGSVVIAQSLTLNVTNLVAGLGIGGLAFALAAKDTIANLFGSLTVILDRPFEIGDAVTINSSITGIVVEVGFRSTRIKTFYQSIITVPNSQLTNVHIDNLGKRSKRRFDTSITIQYDTKPEKIEAFCEGIRCLIKKQELMDKDSFHVYLHNMAASSLDIYLYVFIVTANRAEELAERHKLLMNILRLANDMGVEFAFPTQTLHMFNEQGSDVKESKNNIEDYLLDGEDRANKLVEAPISFKKTRSSANDLTPIRDSELGS